MNDAVVQAADRVESEALRKLERLYPAAVSPLIKKHKGTFERLAKLEKDGAYGRARVLIRQSGLVDDLARALARAGVEAAAIIREEIHGVKEVADDDDAQETG